ncbi:hypothetical protein F5Y15DRAFT_384364 [Xylariaceae sp. FL0016]|nr:hypothetical protein F5Y15DRAFT_384364 [Xylariaceae sp. FL0016]
MRLHQPRLHGKPKLYPTISSPSVSRPSCLLHDIDGRTARREERCLQLLLLLPPQHIIKRSSPSLPLKLTCPHASNNKKDTRLTTHPSTTMATYDLPKPDVQVSVASDAASSFIEHYYSALNSRQPLAHFYASTSPLLTAAGVSPDISINGAPLANGEPELGALLAQQGHPVSYAVDLWDAQPVCPNYQLGCPENMGGPPAASAATSGVMAVENQDGGGGGRGPQGRARREVEKSVGNGERISFALLVQGTVRFGKLGEEGTVEKSFTERFLLVPHWEALRPKASRGVRRWVVHSQNFRAL